ncbi:mandelate racemase/muconate lactonizing enzyme family protein [Dichotomicrobium thermohalophilum]|uniref:L-alanine-DL-glutamate epimerase-like enolase superfamily enzyme n=1 Tax=Dichotomicrobium thermohalophilum TaxID=933063 RepID=A0A397PNL5_9HYPH|nr:mandelate racemase/muconate lactonizing enzyme family protein [Dichotomicrobium thermohalophilum]RIA47331.1 L-alanine-DL-glutamate epimerase-like enolase superfamily enzyme [Dichotomicrobium thermohalophilum]
MAEPVKLNRIEAFVYRVPIEEPVATSFGIMRDRPAVFVRVEDSEGGHGWGEIFANWPAAGAEHRANLLARDVADTALGLPLTHPSDLYRALTARTHTAMVQSGEFGPFRQVIAGLDTAVWDLFARRAGLPLCRFLDAGAAMRVPAYASGIALRGAEPVIAGARAAGFWAFKVKVGFDTANEAEEINRLSGTLTEGERLFADANQAWSGPEAANFLAGVADGALGWLEEPLPVDAPEEAWRTLAGHSHVPLAGGENIAGREAFEHVISEGLLSVIQPDVAKWGGVTECFAVARAALAARRTYCPHFLGGGIGLLASAHLLAAAGGDGLLEVDVNPNPLRATIASPATHVGDGTWTLDAAPGLGVDALPDELARFQTLRVTCP